MANDVITLNLGTGGLDLAGSKNASDEYYQRIKLVDGADATDVNILSGSGVAANALRVELPTNGTGVVGLNAGSATVGTVNLGTFPSAATTSPFVLEDSSSASGDMLSTYAVRQAVPSDSSGTDGDYEPLKIDNGKLWVQSGGSVAHDAALGSNDNPILNGGVAQAIDGTTLDPVAVAAGDITYFRASRDGIQLVSQAHPALASANDNQSTAQTATSIISAPAAGFSIYITDVMVSGAIAVNTVLIHDEDDNVLIPVINTQVSGAVVMNFTTPIKVTAAKAVEYTSTVAQQHSILVNYYVAV